MIAKQLETLIEIFKILLKEKKEKFTVGIPKGFKDGD